MSSGIATVLAHDLLSHGLSSFLRFRSWAHLREASRFLSERPGPPEVPVELLEAVPCHLHIKREMTLSRLEGLAMRKSGRAARAIAARLGDEDEHDHLRSWTLNSLRALAEPGDAWAINAIIGPSGPLEIGGAGVREQALKVLMELDDRGGTAVIVAAVNNLHFAETCKDCRPLKLQARQALEHFAKVAARTRAEPAAIVAVLTLLGKASLETRCSAIRALSTMAPRGDAAVLGGLVQVLAREGRERPPAKELLRRAAPDPMKERLCAIGALTIIAEPGDPQVLQALGSFAEKEEGGTALAVLARQAAREALEALKGAAGPPGGAADRAPGGPTGGGQADA